MSELSERRLQVRLRCCTRSLATYLPLTAAVTNNAVQTSSPGQSHPNDVAVGGGSTPGPWFTLTARRLLQRVPCTIIASTSTCAFPDRLHAISVIWCKWGIEPYIWSEECSPSSLKEKAAEGHGLRVLKVSQVPRCASRLQTELQRPIPVAFHWHTAPSDNQAIWWQEFICPNRS